MAENSAPARDAPRWKLLAWIAFASLLFGVIGLGQAGESVLRVARNSLHTHPASGDVVFVKIDDRSLREIGNWPWKRSVDAQLVDRIADAGARKIMLDINFAFPSEPAEDQALARSISKAGNVWLFTRAEVGLHNAERKVAERPLPILLDNAQLALADVRYDYQNAVWRLPYAKSIDGKKVRSFAVQLADRDGEIDEEFPIDYSIDLQTIPSLSASDVLRGRIDPQALAGKNVLIGAASDLLNDLYFLPGYGRGYGAQVQLLGAETLKNGTPRDFGWVPALLFGLAACALAISRSTFRNSSIVIALAAAVLLFVPIALEARLIFFDVTPGLFALIILLGNLSWRRYRERGMVSEITGLPNLNALRAERGARDRSLVAARIYNFDEILSTLPPNSERQLIDQIVLRINVGSVERTVYHGDGGIFAWFDTSDQPIGNHLEALSALFRTPARVAGFSLDLSVAFGVELGGGKSIPNRLASALVAADEAAHEGLKWKYYDPEAFSDASWRLSMLSQLDDAIDKGEVWIAFQPKLDIASRKVIGAEALARWTHPEKGPIAATEFVAAAEHSNRIAKLTDFVLEKAIAAAVELNRGGRAFDMAVNLSARLLSDRGFSLRLGALLARYGLDPKHLTLELTETAALAGAGEGLQMLERLRDLGVRIAIDDYGTGMSTLEYLKKIPANEIKIDQSFIRGIADSRSDRLMVQSTIGLAHSLGRVVVAEGVEHRDVIDLLSELGCDVAQGFAVGRPMILESLKRRLSSDRNRSAA